VHEVRSRDPAGITSPLSVGGGGGGGVAAGCAPSACGARPRARFDCDPRNPIRPVWRQGYTPPGLLRWLGKGISDAQRGAARSASWSRFRRAIDSRGGRIGYGKRAPAEDEGFRAPREQPLPSSPPRIVPSMHQTPPGHPVRTKLMGIARTTRPALRGEERIK